ncbi:glycosyltransferase family 2 protein [Rhodoferax fermentans]|uniref:Alpha-L-Rha alpha-1,3-L-rhamnosyltransferase n=1 Tax=Rhodoferax fermentans TaxID=28066 RepID=A0A1T1ARB2_RHOFE|nr:glycosyltransferase family 2 protein [Rhodoferax fermentans]MBK1683307.1 glycosyltransferase family 2 protein [Rhodoferax fermentans]OOV06636.1 alpha-L-Rha alpha-1,3-L-rhamnosyltransferase [Rhodoferax fermentans]
MISVCLATYNGGRYVGEQLHSVLMQLGPDDEVVVSDDGSTDNTLAEIARLNDPRLRLLTNSGQTGVIPNFERVLRAARGDTIFLCDQDDVWLPHKVNRCLAVLSECVLVVTDCAVVNSELTTIAPSFFSLRRSGPGLLRNLWKNSYLGCCMAMRRSVLDAALPFPAHIAMHDWWIGLVAERVGAVHFLDETLSLYRRHGGNASQATMHSTASLMMQLRWRLDMALYLLTQPFRHLR